MKSLIKNNFAYKLLRNLYIAVRSGFLAVRVQLQYWFYIRKVQYVPGKTEIAGEKFRRILAVIPHADDELIGAYQFLTCGQPVDLFYCGFTGSRSDEPNRVTRLNEFRQLAARENLPFIDASGFFREKLKECLDSGKYDCIMLPAYIDWHHEHRLVNTAVFELTGGRPASAVLWYAVTVPLASQFFTHYCAMDRVRQKAKWQVFSEVYLSQHMPLLRLRLQEKITGKIAGCFAAENYRLFPDGKDWGETMQKLALREAREYNQLYAQINDLQTIRNSSAHMVE